MCILLAATALPARAQQLHHYSLDGQVGSPAATTNVAFSYTSAMGWAMDSMTITVDGTPHAATLIMSNTRGYVNWDSSEAPNPSMHAAYATAELKRYVYYPLPAHWEYMSISSRTAPSAGDGWDAEFAIADIKLKSVTLNSDVPIRYHNAPLEGWEVPKPQIALNEAGVQTAGHPAAYVRNTSPAFTVTPHTLTGNTDGLTGFTLSFTVDPVTSDPTLTLYQTSGVEASELPFSRTAEVALYDYVTSYSGQVQVQFYVQFPRTEAWQPVGSPQTAYLHGGLFALLDTPAAPMAVPWVDVLEYACFWANGTSTTAAATAAVTTGVYDYCTYNGGSESCTADYTDEGETFYLHDFLNGRPEWTPALLPMKGQCTDLADFLVCASNAIGADDLASQRSDAVANINGWQFTTNYIIASHNQDPSGRQRVTWTFHQWTNGGTIYDASLQFCPTSSTHERAIDMAGPATGTAYFNALVYSIFGNRTWNPQTPFTPDIDNNRPDP